MMMPPRSILVPVDGSPLAEQAIPYAIAIAKRAEGHVRLALVHHEIPDVAVFASPKTYATARLEMQRSEDLYLQALTDRVHNQLGDAVSSVTLTGLASTALAEYVRASGVDLVIMTTHGRGGIQRAWLGSVADHLTRTLTVPTLVLRSGDAAPAAPSFAKILVPLDGSALAEAALGPAATMARLWGASLMLVRVVQPVLLVSDPALPLPSSYDEELTEMERVAAHSYLERMAELIRQQGVQASTKTLVGGAIAYDLLDLLQHGHFGLVALATHGRGGIGRLALGSVADKLIRAAEVPVLVVQPSVQPKKADSIAEQGHAAPEPVSSVPL
jgi:nucleotide-binding universal stress UspA family protein